MAVKMRRRGLTPLLGSPDWDTWSALIIRVWLLRHYVSPVRRTAQGVQDNFWGRISAGARLSQPQRAAGFCGGEYLTGRAAGQSGPPGNAAVVKVRRRAGAGK
jgi:hypothetical protein